MEARPVPADPVTLGEIGRAYGIKGWVWVNSFTRPAENIRRYRQWFLQDDSGGRWYKVKSISSQSKGLVAQLDGVVGRDQAEAIKGLTIVVDAADLAPPGKNEYYWRDLIGCRVRTQDGVELGVVDGLLETGANDVLVVKGDRERLIPFVPDEVVLSVEIAAGQLTVDWDPAF